MALPAAQPILVVDDDEDLLVLASETLEQHGLGPVSTLTQARSVPAFLERNPCSLVMLDLGMPGGDVPLIERIHGSHPSTSVVVVSGRNDVDVAVLCLQRGAYDYLVKPVVPARLVSSARSALGRNRAPANLTVRRRGTPTMAEADAAFAHIVTADSRMREIFDYLRVVAPTGQPVLITGATGTGKDQVARAVHALSGRTGAFVAVNAAGSDDTSFADIMFGHRKGGFVGASEPRAGLVLAASGGSLFLDEVGELSTASQVKLLRLLQDGDYFPLGSDSPKVSSARIIAATSHGVQQLLDAPGFRRDLFYRLKTHHVHLPSLRERGDADVALLLDRFVADACAQEGRQPMGVPRRVLETLGGYPFPGNVRELQSLARDAVARSRGSELDLSPFAAAVRRATPAAGAPIAFGDELPSLRAVQEALIREALERSKGNQAKAAAMLGVTRQALNKRLRGQRDGELDAAAEA